MDGCYVWKGCCNSRKDLVDSKSQGIPELNKLFEDADFF